MSKTIKTNDGEILSAEEKRELRRQRRVRNLVFAYVGLVIFVLALAVGIFFGIRALQSVLNEKGQVQQIEEQLSMMEQEENGMLEEELPVMAGQPSEAELLDEII